MLIGLGLPSVVCVAGEIFGWGKNLDFLKSSFHSFSMVYDTTILNQQTFLVILGPRNNFWLRQGVGEVDQLF